MSLGKKLIWTTFIFLLVSISKAHAKKSVFIISKHQSPSIAQAYSIDVDQVTYRANVDIDAYNPGYGAVGISV